MAYPSSLASLQVREAISDALYRCVLGLDTANKHLFDSAFTHDASFDLNGTVMSGLDAITTGCYDSISKLDTTHFMSNVRVDVGAGTPTASMTASALAQHYRSKQGTEPGAPRLLTGSLYSLDLLEDDKDGLWKIKHWKLHLVWAEGDWGILTGK
ncbi:hypothetical protein HO133_002601 [Letharia lupina]|uniref:SnoaL-like domain-containing protein n=1 Tax=Letharia lupina TaxID=560253 RepID=A0A8H6CCS5_9LECA|nr:uncharacterized protein HO133_002601 [Letharia lupina]KAF6220921.1 hypothetical protein HO133_002601 [Letharia lupina]